MDRDLNIRIDSLKNQRYKSLDEGRFSKTHSQNQKRADFRKFRLVCFAGSNFRIGGECIGWKDQRTILSVLS